MTSRRLVASALCVLSLLINSAHANVSTAQTVAPGAAPPPAQELPALLDFKNSDVYRGDVKLDYDRHPGIAPPSGRIVFDGRGRHRSGFIARPNGPGTFTAPNGTTFYDADFENGLAQGWGLLVVPSSDAAAGLRFVGLFHDGAPLYGAVTYTDHSTYRGYFTDGCYGAAPPVGPAVPPPPGSGTPLADEISKLLPFDPAGTYANAAGATVSGLWHHAGASCSEERVTNARATYPNGDLYAGDLVDQRYAGLGAFYAKRDATHPNDTLLCGTRTEDGAYAAGTFTLTSGIFAPAGADAATICAASYGPDVTVVTATIPVAGKDLDGTADVAFANGDRETVALRAGELSGAGTYVPHAYPATIADTVVNGHLGAVATLTDICGHHYRMRVRRASPDLDAIANDPLPGAPAYLFHACDRFVARSGGSIDGRGRPDGPGTKILTTGQTISGDWTHGRLAGRVTVAVFHPYPATIVVPNVGESGGHLFGAAIVRFTNGDVARGNLNGYALAGAGDYLFAATGCTAHGGFVAGKLRGRVTLRCPDRSTYVGTIGPDGSVQ